MNKSLTQKISNRTEPGKRLSYFLHGGVWLAIVLVLFSSLNGRVSAQASCGSDVPSFYVDFTGNPDSSWLSPNLSRQGNCCGTTSPDRCLRIEFTIDSNVAAVNFDFASGAVPPGSLVYQIDCGPPQNVKSLSCITT